MCACAQGLGSSDTPTLLSTAGAAAVQPPPQSNTGLLVDVLGDLGGAPAATNGAHAASPVNSDLGAGGLQDQQTAVKKSVLGGRMGEMGRSGHRQVESVKGGMNGRIDDRVVA